ncbi:hypothetical protein BJ741DRAFT_621444 [Chytriomyces cf. hyalinus JEL632]|nr:hypothetical protein BJ741DRAFT_621444 [Chytriomyces cf. hyalinus JEL632]
MFWTSPLVRAKVIALLAIFLSGRDHINASTTANILNCHQCTSTRSVSWHGAHALRKSHRNLSLTWSRQTWTFRASWTGIHPFLNKMCQQRMQMFWKSRLSLPQLKCLRMQMQ